MKKIPVILCIVLLSAILATFAFYAAAPVSNASHSMVGHADHSLMEHADHSMIGHADHVMTGNSEQTMDGHNEHTMDMMGHADHTMAENSEQIIEGHNEHTMEGGVNWFAVTLLLGVVGVVGYSASNPGKLKSTNFLRLVPLRKLLKSRWYPSILVLPTTLVFAIILFQLFYGSGEASYNFGSVMVWIFLWPILPVLFLLFGRLWCSICPFSKISDEAQHRFGLNRKVPNFLRKYGVWIVIIAFLIITWSDNVFGIVESPRNTGYLLMTIFIAVVLMGLVFERRSWCRYLCFLGGLSSNYSMSSALELRADSGICKTCKTPLCYKGTEKTKGCPMFEYPRTMDSNRYCNFCSNCIKNCPNDAIKITPRLPTSELWSVKKPHFGDSFLAAALVGMVISQTIVMLEVWEPLMAWFEKATGITNFTVAYSLMFAGSVLIPLFLVLASSFVSSRVSGETLYSNFVRFAYAFIPLGLAIHLAHNAKHFLGEGYSIIYTTASLVGTNLTGDLAILNMPTIQVIQYLLTILGVSGAAYTAHRISKNNPNSKSSLFPHIMIILLFGAISLWMYSVPMAARAH